MKDQVKDTLWANHFHKRIRYLGLFLDQSRLPLYFTYFSWSWLRTDLYSTSPMENICILTLEWIHFRINFLVNSKPMVHFFPRSLFVFDVRWGERDFLNIFTRRCSKFWSKTCKLCFYGLELLLGWVNVNYRIWVNVLADLIVVENCCYN